MINAQKNDDCARSVIAYIFSWLKLDLESDTNLVYIATEPLRREKSAGRQISFS